MDTSYPFPAPVQTFNAIRNESLNAVDLSWTYASEADIAAIEIFRNGKSIFKGSPDAPDYQDAGGIPGTLSTYEIFAYRSEEGASSDGVKAEVIYPELPSVNFKIIAVNDPQSMTSTVRWTYEVPDFDGFEVVESFLTLAGNTRQVSSWVEAVPEQTDYEFVHSKSLSEENFDVYVTPVATRRGDVYRGPMEFASYRFPKLPAPTIVDITDNTNQNYAIISWDYNDLPIDNWELTIDGADEGGVSNTYTLSKEARSFMYETDAESGTETNLDVQLVATRGRKTSRLATCVNCFSISQTFGVNASVTASNDANGQISVDIRASSIPIGSIMKVYREDELLETQTSGASSWHYDFVDYRVQPGKEYLYRVVTITSSQQYESAAIGVALGADGSVTGRVMSAAGNAVAGADLRLVGQFDGDYVIETTTTNSSGQYAFTGLPYEAEKYTEYTVTAVTDGVTYGPASVTAELSNGLHMASVDNIIDQSSITIKGTLQYLQGGLDEALIAGEGSVEIYGIESDGTATLLQSVQTVNGEYVSSVPYDPTIQTYEARLTEDQTANIFHYYHSDVVAVAATGLVSGDELDLDFEDELLVPVDIGFKEACYDLTGYDWSVSLADESGSYQTTLTIPDGSLGMLLPPKNYTLRVMSVYPEDSYSHKVFNDLRAKPISVNLHDELKAYTEADPEDGGTYKDDLLDNIADEFTTDYAFTYISDPIIEIDFSYLGNSQYETIIDGSLISFPTSDLNNLGCEEDDQFFMKSSEGDNKLENYRVSMKVYATTRDGDPCYLNEGRIQVFNNAVYFPGDKEQTLSVAPLEPGEIGEPDVTYFEPATGANAKPNETIGRIDFSAGNINTVDPYTRGIEFHYYDANGTYVTTATRDVTVVGTRALEGSGFILDTDPEMYPLYVLHDPPGDRSSAWIESGSSLSYEISSTSSSEYRVGGAIDFKYTVGGIGGFAQTETTTSQNDNSIRSRTITLNFSERIETAAPAAYNFELEEYELNGNSDVIVGVGAINAYGAAREVQIDESCQIHQDLVLTVEPARIETTWAMTVMQLKQDSAYYQKLVDGVIESSVEDEDGEDFMEDVDSRLGNITDILSMHRAKKNGTVMNMCNYVKQMDMSFLEHSITNDIDFDYIDAFRNLFLKYCDECLKEANGRYYEFESSDWGENASDFNKLSRQMQGFNKVWTFYEIIRKNWVLNHLESNDGNGTSIDIINNSFNDLNYDFVENLTFSAGLSMSKSFESIELDWRGESDQTTIDFSLFGGLAVKDNQDINSLISSKEVFDLESNIGAIFKTAHSGTISQKRSAENTLKLGYNLSDDDVGDEFNTWVITDPTGHHYFSSPEFYLTSGASSCPYEKGTIKRDDFELSIVDENGDPAPTVMEGIAPGSVVYVYARMINNSPLEETRKAGFTGGKNAGFEGATVMVFGNFPAHPNFANGAFIEGNKPLDLLLKLSPIFNDGVTETNFPLVAGPECTVTNLSPDEVSEQTMTVTFELETSPVSLRTGNGDWLVNNRKNDDGSDSQNRQLSIVLNDLEADNRLYQFENVSVHARSASAAQTEWEVLSDIDDVTYYSKEDVIGGQNVFIWRPESAQFPDGDYYLKGVVVGDDGGYSESDLWSGRIDLNPAFAATLPEPADGLLSLGDGIGVKMSEEINSSEFYNTMSSFFNDDSETIKPRILIELFDVDVDPETGDAADTLDYNIDPALSDFTVSVNGSDIDIVVKQDKLDEFDGKQMKVTLTDMEDMAQNQSDEISWYFWLQPNSRPVSEVALAIDENTDGDDRFWISALDDPTVEFEALDYDAFEVTSALSSIDLEYRMDQSGASSDWTHLYTFEKSDLQGVDGDKYELDLSPFDEGDYEFRLVAIATSGTRESNVLKATIDRTRPVAVSQAPDLLEYTRDFQFVINEDIHSVGQLEFIANLEFGTSSVPFGAIRGYAADNIIYCVLDDVDPDYDLLSNKFGWDLKISFENITDLAGNLLDEVSIPVGNYAQGLSPVDISENGWLMNSNNQQVSFNISDYVINDPDFNLHSVSIVYRKQGDDDYTELENFLLTDAELSNAAFTYTWDISSNTALEDGIYEVHAVVYDDESKVAAYYSEVAAGIIDRTAPSFVSYTPEDDIFHAEDEMFVLKFTEPMDLDVTAAEIKVSHFEYIVNVGNSEIAEVDASLYDVVVKDEHINIIPTTSFIDLYKSDNENLTVSRIRFTLNAPLEDANGNALYNLDVGTEIDIVIDDIPSTSSSRSYSLLEGELLESGEVSLTWENYQLFDNTIVERSRTGSEFVAIETFNGDITGFIDGVSFNRFIFYRLRQASSEGDEMVSNTLILENPNALDMLNTYSYPSPSDGYSVHLSIATNDLDNVIYVDLVSVSGSVSRSYQFAPDVTVNDNITLDFGTKLKPGIYLMTVRQGDQVSTEKVYVD